MLQSAAISSVYRAARNTRRASRAAASASSSRPWSERISATFTEAIAAPTTSPGALRPLPAALVELDRFAPATLPVGHRAEVVQHVTLPLHVPQLLEQRQRALEMRLLPQLPLVHPRPRDHVVGVRERLTLLDGLGFRDRPFRPRDRILGPPLTGAHDAVRRAQAGPLHGSLALGGLLEQPQRTGQPAERGPRLAGLVRELGLLVDQLDPRERIGLDGATRLGVGLRRVLVQTRSLQHVPEPLVHGEQFVARNPEATPGVDRPAEEPRRLDVRVRGLGALRRDHRVSPRQIEVARQEEVEGEHLGA